MGQMLLVPSAKDLIPQFAAPSMLGAHYGALATAGGIAVLAGNFLLGSQLDRALTPSADAIYLVATGGISLCKRYRPVFYLPDRAGKREPLTRYFSAHVSGSVFHPLFVHPRRHAHHGIKCASECRFIVVSTLCCDLCNRLAAIFQQHSRCLHAYTSNKALGLSCVSSVILRLSVLVVILSDAASCSTVIDGS